MRSRPALVGGLFLAALVVLAAGGLFALQYGQALAQCSMLFAAPQCSVSPAPSVAMNAVFASLAGLLLAAIMAISLGMGPRRDHRPNTALARRLSDEERYLEHYRQRRAQLDEWTAMAKARAAERAAEIQTEGELGAQWTVGPDGVPIQAGAAGPTGAAGQWQEEGKPAEETDSQMKSRVLTEHLMHLARVKPEAVASVVSGWINSR
ncbi:MAG TPA: hypothetical protein VF157_05065 [Chloroflexota bacterium]